MTYLKNNSFIKLLRLSSIFIILIFIFSCKSENSTNNNNDTIESNEHDHDHDHEQTFDENDIKKIVVSNEYIRNVVEVLGGRLFEIHVLEKSDSNIIEELTGDNKAFIKKADAVIYSSLEVSSKIKKSLNKVSKKKKVTDIMANLDTGELMESKKYTSGYDPNIWFNTGLWQKAMVNIAKTISEINPKYEYNFKSSYIRYAQSVSFLKRYASGWLERVPAEKRIIITQNDFIKYMIKDFGYELIALSEENDLSKTADYIIEKKIPAVFYEYKMDNSKTDELVKILNEKGYEIKKIKFLYTNHFGEKGTKKYSYLENYKSNIKIIQESLSGEK